MDDLQVLKSCNNRELTDDSKLLNCAQLTCAIHYAISPPSSKKVLSTTRNPKIKPFFELTQFQLTPTPNNYNSKTRKREIPHK